MKSQASHDDIAPEIIEPVRAGLPVVRPVISFLRERKPFPCCNFGVLAL